MAEQLAAKCSWLFAGGKPAVGLSRRGGPRPPPSCDPFSTPDMHITVRFTFLYTQTTGSYTSLVTENYSAGFPTGGDEGRSAATKLWAAARQPAGCRTSARPSGPSGLDNASSGPCCCCSCGGPVGGRPFPSRTQRRTWAVVKYTVGQSTETPSERNRRRRPSRCSVLRTHVT
jgi:hypothetical protein